MSECILWTGAVTNRGYGQATRSQPRRKVYVHREAWENANGPIPAGRTIHHRCGQRTCLNVEHMELLTRAEHAGVGGHGKLTAADADEIRRRVEGGERQVDLARAFDVSRALVCKIMARRVWA